MTSNKNNVTHETLNGSETSTLKKGPWTSAEDAILVEYVKKHGEGNWNTVQKNSGLSRCGKSCRLRWANHLRPNLKKGSFTLEEEHLILELHGKLGNKWARMAAQLPGRTDNEIKNYWNTRVKRRQRAGLSLYPSNPNDIQKQPSSFHHHQHHPYLTQASQIPSNFTSFSSTQNHKPNFGSQIPNFSPINTSIGTPFQTHLYNTHFFSSPINGLKRFRDDNYSFPQPLSSPQTLQPSSSFFNQKFLPPQQQKVEFNPSNFDLNTPQTIQQNQFEHKPMFPISSGFSMKLELPSDQPPHSAGTDPIDFKNNGSLTRSDSGLLDAMIQEVQAMGDSEGMKRKGLLMDQEGKCKISGLVENGPSPNTESLYGENDPKTPPLGSTGRWNYSSPAHSAIGGSRKEYTDDPMNSVEDGELSSLLDIIPSSIFDSEFYSGGGGEISNGQSSGVTDESATNLTTTTTSTTAGEAAAIPEHDWITASGWDNLPEMC